MLFSDALFMLKNDDTINGIICKDKRVIIDRSTKVLYLGDGTHFSPSYDDIISEEWELERC